MFSPDGEENTMVKIGWGRREYSLDAPVNINGQMFMRVSEGILDPLYATALAIDGGAGQDAFVFCSVDITVFPLELYTEVLEAVAEKRPEIPKNGVMLGATHTHTSMDVVNPKSRTPDGVHVLTGEEIRPHVVEQISDAICEAWDSRAAGGIAYGYGYAVVGHSRRPVYFRDMNDKYGNIMAPHGKCVMYGKTSEPEFSHYETNADPTVNLMFTYDAEQKLTGIVVNIPCPSQSSEMMTKLSADYWAQIREEVAKAFGAEVYVLPQCAPAGDISPRPLHYLPAESRRFRLKYGVGDEDGKLAYFDRAMSRRHDIAERVVACIQEVHEWASREIRTNVTVRQEMATIPLTWRPVTEEEKLWCEKNLEEMKAQIPSPETCTPEEYRVAKNRYDTAVARNSKILRYYEMQKTQKTLPFDVFTAQIGEVAWGTCPFELFGDYMLRIQGRSPFVQTFLIQLVGDRAGYLPTRRACENKSYSACMFDNLVTDVGGQELVEYLLKKFNEYKA